MDARYQHEQVTALWSKEWTHDAWWRIEQAAVRSQRGYGIVDHDETNALVEMSPDFNDERTLSDISISEAKMNHDVAAFVAYMRSWFGEPHGRWIHFGLTSSDLVDTAQGMRFKALAPTLYAASYELDSALSSWRQDNTPILGRTHGEPAEPMAMRMRAEHWSALVQDALMQLKLATEDMQVAKLSGPVGSFAHNPPVVERDVAFELSLRYQGKGASQIVPRGLLARWATSASQVVNACAKVAMDFRLMLLLGEATETRPKDQVGSSSMAHKTNPIRAEQIAGMARLAAGYASMLQPLDLWLERDISSSCVERVAVPDLWHIALHVIQQTTMLLGSIAVGYRGTLALDKARGLPFVHRATLDSIRAGHDADSARREALLRLPHKEMSSPIGDLNPMDQYVWFARNYPKDNSDRA